jgi:hypothetical protein
MMGAVVSIVTNAIVADDADSSRPPPGCGSTGSGNPPT